MGYPIASRCESPVAQFTAFSFSFADSVAGWTVTEKRGQGCCFWLRSSRRTSRFRAPRFTSGLVFLGTIDRSAAPIRYFDSIVSHARVSNELGVGVSFRESVQGSSVEEGAARGCTTLGLKQYQLHQHDFG